MSNDKLLIGVGQALEIQQAFRREGPWTNKEIKMACERRGFLTDARNVLLGRAEIRTIEHLVNCDEVPFTPENWSILPDSEQLPNRVKGLYRLDVTKVILHLSKEQEKGGGNELRNDLKKEAVLPANVLDFLLQNQHLIPQEWKGKYVFFWGTIYSSLVGILGARCLYYRDNDGWRSSCDWLDSIWGGGNPAAVLASN